jgi:hypothetical protein
MPQVMNAQLGDLCRLAQSYPVILKVDGVTVGGARRGENPFGSLVALAVVYLGQQLPRWGRQRDGLVDMGFGRRRRFGPSVALEADIGPSQPVISSSRKMAATFWLGYAASAANSRANSSAPK